MRKRFRSVSITACLAFAVALCAAMPVGAQRVKQEIVLSGRIISRSTGKAVAAATVAVVELKLKIRAGEDGSYSITLPGPGLYTVVVSAPPLRPSRAVMQLNASMVRDFALAPAVLEGVTVVGKRDIQKVARYTMTVQQLKEVPASFGDSVTALTALAGVIRTNDFFGPLVIRGGDPLANNYFVDDIPIYSPLHYGGFHCVINNNMMSEIDLYSSAFSAQFGLASSAVINIITVDEVQRFSGYTNIGAFSADALIQTPILRNTEGGVRFATPEEPPRDDERRAGYFIVSGRYSYYSLLLPAFYNLIGDSPSAIPEYWDYQSKAKFHFNDKNSITLFLMGSSDYIKFVERDEIKPEEGDDPLLKGIRAKLDKSAHSQGLYYTWQPSAAFTNKLIAFSSLSKSIQYFSAPNASTWLRDIHITSLPYIFGLKEKFRLTAIKNYLELRGGLEYTLYCFRARGITITTREASSSGFNPGDEDLFAPLPLDQATINETIGGYFEPKLTIGKLTFTPGFRSDYLRRSGEATIDPRGMLSYEFPTATTLSVAGGHYSYHFQTNPFIFDGRPDLARVGRDLVSEKAIHRAVGIEQEFSGLYKIKIEGFYNNFYDLPMEYYHYKADGSPSPGMATGKIRAYGFELTLSKDIREDQNGLYGWVNYTYTHSRFKSGLPTYPGIYGIPQNGTGDSYGDQWINYSYEMQHALKLVAAYKYREHTWSAKFQLYTSLPYTPIVSSQLDTNYTLGNRNYPIYGRTNSKRFPATHRLDLRYTFKAPYSWGYVSWYVEIINCYNYMPEDYEDWNYLSPYVKGKNPRKRASSKERGFAMIPTVGVEVKF